MKLLLINSSFTDGRFIEEDGDSVREVLKNYLIVNSISPSVFVSCYGDWEVYTKGSLHLLSQGTVSGLLTT